MQYSDEQAIARYRYLLRTAPPEAIEEAHAEAFAGLTPQQRALVLQQLATLTPEAARVDARQLEPRALARLATRAEMREPGLLERGLGAIGLGGLFAGSLLGTIAGTVIGTAVAHQLLGGFDQAHGAEPGEGEADPPADEGEADLGGGDFDAGDF